MGDYGSAPGAAAELHLKMSKKIAQLTKVIFHLNTRNEDFQMEFAHLKQVHSLELTQLTHDAAAKLKLMTEQLTAQRDLATQAELNAARDKQQFMKDLALFQQEAATQQSATQHEFQRRVQMLEEQVEQSRRAFVDRIQQLTQMAEAQQKTQQSSTTAATAAMQATHRAEIDELKRKHTEEVEGVVMSSNARYTQMLADQLRLQDELKTQLANESTKWQSNATREQHALQLQIKQQHEAAQARFDEMKHQLVTKIEHLLADAESLRGNEAKLRTDKEELLKTQAELQRQLKLLELQLTKAQQETLSVRKDAEANAVKLQQLLAMTGEKSSHLGQELEAVKKTLAQREDELQVATKERDTLQLELLHGSASSSERQLQYQQQLNERDLKLANLHAELSQLRQQTSTAEAQHIKSIQALEARVLEKEKEVADLQQKLANAELLRVSVQRDKDKSLGDVKTRLDEAEKTITTLRADHSAMLQSMSAAHAEALETMRGAHAREAEKLTRENDRRVAEVESRLTQDSSASLERALREAKQQHSDAIAQLQSVLAAKEAEWEKERTSLLEKAALLQTQLTLKTKEAADAVAQVADLSAKWKKAVEELTRVAGDKDTLVKASQKSQKERDDAFQKQIKELTAQHENALRRLTSEKDRLVLEHKQTLLQLAHDHAETLAKAQSEWEETQRTRLASQNHELTAFYESQLDQVKAQLKSEREQAEATADAARCKIERLTEGRLADYESFLAEARRISDNADHSVAALQRSHLEQLDATAAGHAADLEQLKSKFRAEKEELTRSSVNHLEQKRAELTATHEVQMEGLRQDHALAMRAMKESLEAQRNSEALALRAEMALKLKELRAQKDQDQARAIAELKAVHDAAYDSLSKKADSLQASLTQRTSDLEASRAESGRLSSALDTKTQEMHDRVALLERQKRDEVERLKLAAKRDMDRLLEENLAETKQLSDQFEETRRLMLDKVAVLKASVAEWEDKYLRRESRPEDVARIASLERAVVERDALVKQTLDEMAYFKRELLNREEMYNKTFARTPNVGVLNVLKPHVQLQAQLQAQSQNQNQMTPPIPVPPASGSQTPQTAKRKTKLMAHDGIELQRRGSERGTAGTTTKKSLPPLVASNNNQGFGL